MSISLRSGTVLLGELSKPLLLIHGGAGPADPKGEDAMRVRDALKWVLSQSTPSTTKNFPTFLEKDRAPRTAAEVIVLRAAHALEEHPRFNAGFGASLQEDGVARVSASFMESERRCHSAVINVTETLHPSELAFYLQFNMSSNVLDTSGAHILARELQVPRANLVTLERFEKFVARKKEELISQLPPAPGTGTIGAVSIDSNAKLAAATSTGGIGNESIGRVGDTPTVAGNYCSELVAISCTGYGEQIVNSGFSVRVATRVDDGADLERAVQISLSEAESRGYEFAAIAVALDKKTNSAVWVAGSIARHFVWAALTPTDSIYF